jgi:hypothetical protein
MIGSSSYSFVSDGELKKIQKSKDIYCFVEIDQLIITSEKTIQLDFRSSFALV